jgi:hypothetical protein
LPSIERATEVARVDVHFSWIIVGALHDTGDGGLAVKPEMVGPSLATVVTDPAVVVVGPAPVDVVELPAVVLEVGIDETVELVVLVVVGGVLLFLELLQAAATANTAIATTTRPRTGARRCTNGGYAHAPPYPGQRCLDSSIPRRAT